MRVGQAKTWRWALVPAAVGLGAVALTSPAGAASGPTARTGTVVTAQSTTTYGLVLVVGGPIAGPLAGDPLYLFSGDGQGKVGCTTRRASGYDITQSVVQAMTCTGPESDFVNDVGSDDWPALTTTGAPLAGPGVSQSLLGTVYRPGIGRQVTYGGHPLYLFDDLSVPFDPQGEGYFETVAPLLPWHGLWDLVSARGGQPAPGPATVETETLPNGKTAVAVEEYPNVHKAAITVYSFSRDRRGDSVCTGTCAVTWIPVLTTGRPRVAGGIAVERVGVIERPDRTEQVTYDGKPLYLYSAEKEVLHPMPGLLQTSGTLGNGNGLSAPSGGKFSIIYPG